MKQLLTTTALLGLLTGLFLAVGYMVGGQSGALIALLLAAVTNFGMYWFSGTLVLKMQKAIPLSEYPDQHVQATITRAVRELTAADNLPMPKLYVVDTPLPNAFATGRGPKHAAVAATTGILDILTDDELKAVIGHELGHVKNRDMLVSTIAATVAGAISFIAQMAFWGGALFGGGDEESPNPFAAMAMLILAPLAASLIQLAVSRSREYAADQHGKKLMGGDGRDLANALRKLENFKRQAPPVEPTPAQQSSAHLMFANMFTMRGLGALFSTHPSTEQRIARLES
jgi:heat shock protein HtpX